MFISLEGIDGSGKSAQLTPLLSALRDRGTAAEGWKVLPDRPIRLLYKQLLDTEETFPSPLTSLFLSLADYASLLSDGALPYGEGDRPRENKQVLVADRYIFSTFADCLVLGLPVEQLRPLARLFPAPDLTVIVDVPADEALRRKGGCTLAEAGGPEFVAAHGELHHAFVAYQEAVRTAYRDLAAAAIIPRAAFVDGTGTREEVLDLILRTPEIKEI